MALTYVRLIWRVLDVIGDTSDPDHLPDDSPLPDKTTVTITMTPATIIDTSERPAITHYPQPIPCTLDSLGNLLDPQGNLGVYIIDPTDQTLQPHDWTIQLRLEVPGRTTKTWSVALTIAEPDDPDLPGVTTYDITRNGPVPQYAGSATDASVYATAAAGSATAAAGSASDAAASAASVQRGLPGGVASLDSAGLVPVGQVPDLSGMYVSLAEPPPTPERWGAVGDGVADDAPAVLAAITAATEADNGTVAGRPGSLYRINSKLQPPAGIFRLEKMRLKSGAPMDFMIELMQAHVPGGPFPHRRIAFVDVEMDAQAGGGCLRMANSLRISIERCFLYRFSSGIGLHIDNGTGSHDVVVDGLFVDEFPETDTGTPTGIGIKISAPDNLLSNVIIADAATNLLVESSSNRFNQVHTYGASTWALDITAAGSFNTFSGCYFDNAPVRITNPWHVKITDSGFVLGKSIAGYSFIVLKPSSATPVYLRGLSITQCFFQNISGTEVDSIVVDSSNGTFNAVQSQANCVADNSFVNTRPRYSRGRARSATTTASADTSVDVSNLILPGFAAKWAAASFVPTNAADASAATIKTLGASIVATLPTARAGTMYVQWDTNPADLGS